MVITSTAQAIAVRDAVAHKFHLIQDRTTDPGTKQMLAEVAEALLALDAWVVEKLQPHDDTGAVVHFDGGNKGP